MSHIDARHWSHVKSFVDTYNVPMDWIDLGDAYVISAVDKKNTGHRVDHTLYKVSSDITDFENNYKGTIVEKSASTSVNGSSEGGIVFTPNAGEKVIISEFSAEGIYSRDVMCRLVWDYNTQNEEVIWSIRGAGSMPFYHVIPSSDTDGTKKIAAVIANGLPTSIHASVFFRLYRI